MNGNDLQTAIRQFRHAVSGRRVTLVGAMHIGQTRYYDELRFHIEQLEKAGAAVQFERILPVPDNQQPTPQQLAAIQEMGKFLSVAEAMAVQLGWVRQMVALRYEWHPDWQNVDMSILDLVRGIGPEAIIAKYRNLNQSAGKLLPGPNENPESAALRVALLHTYFRLMANDITAPLLRIVFGLSQPRNFRPVVLTQRSFIGINGLQKLPEDRDAVLIWGADHLEEMGGLLVPQGYREVKTTWHTVATLPPLTDELKTLLGQTQENKR